MNLTGTYTFNAERQTVWNLLMDPQAIAKALPGVQALTPVEGEANAWRATAKIGLGPVSGSFTGIIRMSDLQAPEQYTLSAQGEGQQSIIGGTAHITLTPDAGGAKTLLTWNGEVNISGKLAGIGQRLIGGAATMMANQFFSGLAKQLPTS